jgi:hypothetical protein
VISATGVIPDLGADLTSSFGPFGAGFLGPVGVGEMSDRFFVSYPSLDPGDTLFALLNPVNFSGLLGQFTVVAVPEPAGALLLGAGAIVMAMAAATRCFRSGPAAPARPGATT